MILRIASALMALLFLVAAGLQANDPDPIGWAAIYAAAAIVSVLGALPRRFLWPAAGVVGLAAAIWAGTLAPRVFASGMLADMAKSMGPSTNAEEAREFLGLSIVALWMAVIGIARRKRRPG